MPKPKQRDHNYPRQRDTQTLLRLTRDDKALLLALAEDWGLTMNDVVMLLVRAECRKRGIALR